MRQHICKSCGKIYLTDKTDNWYCPSCAAASRSESVLQPRECKDCGKIFMAYPKSIRCKDCQVAVTRKRDVELKRNGTKRKLGSIDTCTSCGKNYIVNSGMQRYCQECAKTVVSENIKAQKRAWAKKHREEQNARKAEMRKYRKVCAICGNPFTSNTPTVTCSPSCAEEYRRKAQAIVDVRRGKADPRRVLSKRGPIHPQSGVPGIYWHQEKWEVRIGNKYVGIRKNLADAKQLLAEYVKSNPKV